MKRPIERLSVPKACNVCTSECIELQWNESLSRNEHVCTNCDAKVGCHAGTNEPMGALGHSEVRKLRAIAHAYFDRIWKDGYLKRFEAYHWLSDKLGLGIDACHFSRLDEWQLERAIHICQKFLRPESLIKFRRELKRDVKRAKQREREKLQIRRRKSY